MLKVIKRDGTEQNFREDKIYRAVYLALQEVDTENIEKISAEITNKIHEMTIDKDEISVDEVHHLVENLLEEYSRVASTAYRVYRDNRDAQRDKKRLLEIDKKILGGYSDRASNGNVDENTFGGKNSLILEKEMEGISLNKMQPTFAKKHLDREIYIHDLNNFANGMHNCLNVDIESLLNEGAGVGQGDLRPTKRFSTAMQLIPVYIQIQSQSQYGGAGVPHIDFILQPYIERLIAEKLNDVLEVYGNQYAKEQVTLGKLKELTNAWTYDIVIRRVKKQIHESCQALITNLVTLQTRGTQTPFSSINFGGNVSPEGLLFNNILLEEIDRGIGRKNKTAIFPILVYYTRKDLNLYEGTPGFELTKKAIEVQGRRHYPTFCNGDWSMIPRSNNWRNWHVRMGCRTSITSDINANSEDEKYRQVGRGNFAPHTLCLPIIAMKVKRSGGGLKEFYNKLLEDIEMAKDSLLERYEIAKANNISIAPTMYGSSYGIDIRDAKKPEDFLRHCTFAIGFVGLYEAYEILTNKKFYDTEEDLNEAVNIIKTIHDKAIEYTNKYHLNFSCYGSPSESLATKVMATLKDVYGYESERDFVTNSCHVPVWEKMSIFKKIDVESRFSEIATGGSIFHCEIDATTTNMTANLKILQYAMEKNIPYFRFSHKTCTCKKCGYTLEAVFDKCPECGCEDVEILTTITGYLVSELRRMNRGKQSEIKNRAILVSGELLKDVMNYKEE